MADQSPVAERDALREIPLSRIVVPDGFNPRGEVVDHPDSRMTGPGVSSPRLR